jgi:ribokinase
MTASIVVVGSLNMDLVMRMQRAPAAGQTVPGEDFAMLPGGKGANQAVACARMGASVAMVGRVGIDANGDVLKAALATDNIDAREVKALASTHTGVASIWVEDDGQNRIVLAPGANGLLDAASVTRAGPMIAKARMLIVQLEVPLPAVQTAIERAKEAGVTVLMNPAPALPLPDALWSQIDILVLNETEASDYAGLEVSDPVTAATAGDTFIGALCAALCEGQSLDAAVAQGQAASALCVTRRGAQTSIPYKRQLTPASAA